ncbi:MAG TPA: hemerythrin domain-containing protein [Candidatus Binatia bacterium]|nr:hemerythrin domain-containing protein [Candidatus Binatia bacterium]
MPQGGDLAATGLARDLRRLRARVQVLSGCCDTLGGLTWGAIDAMMEETLSFLVLELGPYMTATELVVHPEISARLGRPEVAGQMLFDHRCVRVLTAQLAELRVSDAAGPDYVSRLRAGLGALCHLLHEHLEAEETHLATLQSRLAAAEAADLYSRMDAAVHEQTALLLRARRRAPSGADAEPRLPLS